MATSVKNTAKGARGLRTKGGDLVMIEPGQSASGDFSDQEVRDFKAMLKAETAPAAVEADDDDAEEPKALASMNKTELLKVAGDEEVTTALDGDGKEVAIGEATNKQIVAAIEKKRAG